jgi:RNA polymerase sigma factor (sigma-70 family)
VSAVAQAVRPARGPTRFERAHREVRCEIDLVVAAQGDPEARSELLDTFRPLVASVARTYARSTSVDRAELMQEGVVGLLRALKRYDARLGTPFWAYAGWWVRQAMQQLVTETMRPVVLSDRAVRQLARIKDARSRFAQANGREAGVGDLAVSTGLSRDQIGFLVAAERRPRALEEPVDGEHGGAGTFGELLADPGAEDAYEGVTWRVHLQELPRLLAGLSERERAVVCGHYGVDCPEQTLRELAERFHVSAERVRQIEKTALDKLRAAIGI